MMTEQAHEVLADIESIKQLKARYCRFLDTKDWVAWRGIFTDDFVSDTSEAGGKVIAGADDFVAFVRKNLARPSQPTAHQVHTPEIEVTSATTARGVWALQDVVRFGPGREPGGLRPLPRDLREDRRAVADQDVQADPAA